MKIAVIPIDNRPICYDLIEDILSIDSSIELFMPKISSLGGLTTSSKTDEIFNFLEALKDLDYLVVSLDTLAYGGLVSSRRCDDDFTKIKTRIEKFKQIASKKAKKILAFSSIMRISNNNINEEEKLYWASFGKKIFDWSYKTYKNEVLGLKGEIKNDIPKEILEDYLKTRKRNFEINKIYLNWAKEGFFDTLIFSKDDCAEFGLNVKEANILNEEIKNKSLTSTLIKTGADEIPLGLLARAISDFNRNKKKIKIKPVFLEENSTNLISKYEDIPIESCAKAQLELANCEIKEKNADLTLIINNFKKEQGDLVLGSVINFLNKTNHNKTDIFPKEKYFIADVNNANGSDKSLVEELFKEKNIDNFYGYCGYNTSANTLGCAIFCAIVKFFAKLNNSYNDLAFKKIQFIRLLDDWAYQAISRKFIRESAPNFIEALEQKKDELNKNALKISNFLDFYPEKISYSLPWERSFEIRIKV